MNKYNPKSPQAHSVLVQTLLPLILSCLKVMEELDCGNFDIDIRLSHPIIVVTGFLLKPLTLLNNGSRKQIRSCRRRLSKS